MAKQQGINTYSGSIGNLNFYNSMYGPIVRKRSSLSRKKIFNDPKMIATVQNVSEFARASHQGKLLRDAVKQFLPFAKDNLLASRMQSILIKIVKTDSINDRGSRSLVNGDLTLLRKFELNKNAPFCSIFANNIQSTIDRADNKITINVPRFQPEINLRYPENTTHYKLASLCCEVDFVKQITYVDNYFTPMLIINDDLSDATRITHKLSKDSTLPVFLIFAVQFFELVNGQYHLLLNYDYNPAIILEVDQVR